MVPDLAHYPEDELPPAVYTPRLSMEGKSSTVETLLKDTSLIKDTKLILSQLRMHNIMYFI